MRTTLGALLALSLAASESLGGEPTTYPLWPDGAPGALGKDAGDAFHAGDRPTITVSKPDPARATGASVVVCPGGGYAFLATEHEGKDVADWLNSMGVTAIVLKYRLGPRYRHPTMLGDAQRALRTVRAKSADWGLDPKRVAILGFSAGGHLASTAATHFDDGRPDAVDPIDRLGCRPDLAILVYPVITMTPPYAHDGSRKNLLGDAPPADQVEDLSNERRVTKQTPPTFLVVTGDDTVVPVENSLLFASALRRAGVPFELHVFEKGTHGLGLGEGWTGKIPPDEAFRAWPNLCATWLKRRGFLDPRPAAGP